jgi:hypothetical protein
VALLAARAARGLRAGRRGGAPLRVLAQPRKLYLLERNRLLFLLTAHEARTLALLALPLLALELAMLLLALSQGWAGGKVRGWWWLLRHAGLGARRRRPSCRPSGTVPDAKLARLLTAELSTTSVELPRRSGRPQRPAAAWWLGAGPQGAL